MIICTPWLTVLATGRTTVTVGGDFGIAPVDELPVLPVFDNGTTTAGDVCFPVSVLVELCLVEIMFPVIIELPITDGFEDPLLVTTTAPPLFNALTDITLAVVVEGGLIEIFVDVPLTTLCPVLTETILALPLTTLVPLPLLTMPFLIKSFCPSMIV